MGNKFKQTITKEEAMNIITNANLVPIDFEGEYKNSHTKLTCLKDNKFKVLANVSDLKRGQTPLIYSVSNPYTIENIKLWLSENNQNIILHDTNFVSNTHKMKYTCRICGVDDEISWASLWRGYGCSVCSGQKTLAGYNDITTTRPDLVKYFIDKNEANKLTKNSNLRKSFKCPDCGYIAKDVMIKNLKKNGFVCRLCGDSISTPEKFMGNILHQLNVDFLPQYSPSWAKKFRYDFYFNYNDADIIIEINGMQHYQKNNFTPKIDNKMQEVTDKNKKDKAIKNGIQKYYVIDCSVSTFDFLKNNIINEVSDLFDFENINWELIWKNCQNSTMKRVCESWNDRCENDTTQTIADHYNVDVATIRIMLHRGTSLGYCIYDSKIEKSKVSSRAGEKGIMVEMYSLEGQHIKTFKSIKQARKESNVSLMRIKRCCNGDSESEAGFKWRFAHDNGFDIMLEVKCKDKALFEVRNNL